jgi:hypothetical protein
MDDVFADAHLWIFQHNRGSLEVFKQAGTVPNQTGTG